MSASVFNDAYQALNLNQAQNQPIIKNEKAGRLNNRTITVVMLAGASILVATAAIVAAVFASYLVAAVCAGSCLLLAFSAILASQIKHSPALLDLIKKMTQKITNLLLEIKELRGRQPLPVIPSPNQELLKQIEELKRELENKNKLLNIPTQDLKIPKIEVLIPLLDEKFVEIPQVNTPEEFELKEEEQEEEEVPEKVAKLQNLQKETELLKKEPEEKDELLKVVELNKNDAKADLLKDLNQDEEIYDLEDLKKLVTTPSDLQVDPTTMQKKEKEEELQSVEVKKNQKKKKKKPKKNKDNFLDIAETIKKLENKEIQKLNKIEINQEFEDKLKPILNEIIRTEKSFNIDLKKLPTYLQQLKNEKIINQNEYQVISNNWQSLIMQSDKLIKKLENLEDLNIDISQKLKALLEAFSPEQIKAYLHLCVEITSSKMHAFLLSKESIPVVDGLIKSFEKSNNMKVPSGITITPLQRIVRFQLLMESILKKVELQQDVNLTKALQHNLSYVIAYTNLMNALTPKF